MIVQTLDEDPRCRQGIQYIFAMDAVEKQLRRNYADTSSNFNANILS